MGCDIHVFPEISKRKNADGSDDWMGLCGEFDIWRDYDLFGIMAGVRRGDALFAPRGVPPDISYSTRWKNELIVVDRSVAGEGECTQWDAERWGGYVDEKKDRVYHPDWHTHSWLTLGELEKCVEKYVVVHGGEPECEVYALMAMLRECEERGHKTRIVFWFDN
jgi:hypothetical protein